MLRPLYLAIVRLYLGYRVTALHTSISNGGRDLVYNGQIHEPVVKWRSVPVYTLAKLFMQKINTIALLPPLST